MTFSQGSAYNELLQNFHMISFFKNFPTNFKSKIINGSYESINTYAILLALRSEPVMHQRSINGDFQFLKLWKVLWPTCWANQKTKTFEVLLLFLPVHWLNLISYCQFLVLSPKITFRKHSCFWHRFLYTEIFYSALSIRIFSLNNDNIPNLYITLHLQYTDT